MQHLDSDIERSRHLRCWLAAINYATHGLELEFTRKFPPMFCHGSPFFPAS
jgi:hypothetical protein